MANLPYNVASSSADAHSRRNRRLEPVEQMVLDICDPELRQYVLPYLSKKRVNYHVLAPMLWHSYGTIAVLLQEIISVYPYLSPPTLTMSVSNRACNALMILQSVASHRDTRILFLEAHIPLYLYLFLYTKSKTRPFEYLRLCTLEVIKALVEVDATEVIFFLLQTEIIPLCLHTMDIGGELTRTAATYIVQKILLDEIGLRYICFSADRFFAVCRVLGSMVTSLSEEPSARLLKYIIHCYLSLSKHPRACECLKACLPNMLKDGTFSNCLRDDPMAWQLLQELLYNISIENRAAIH